MARKTLCHAKRVLRCERSKKKREKLENEDDAREKAMMERCGNGDGDIYILGII